MTGEPMPSSNRGKKRRVAVGLVVVSLWATLFAALVGWLPRSPDRRVLLEGFIRVEGIVGERFLVASRIALMPTAPYVPPLTNRVTTLEVVDLETGGIRAIELPRDVDLGEIEPAIKPLDGTDKPPSGQRTRLKLTPEQILVGGESAVVLFSHEEAFLWLVVVWDVRSGAERFRRVSSRCTLNVNGDWLLIRGQGLPKSPGDMTTLLNLTTGRGRAVVTRPRPGAVLADRNGRFVVNRESQGVRITHLEGRFEFAMEKERFAFSSDSRWLAAISPPEQQNGGLVQRLRIVDLEEGRVKVDRLGIAGAPVRHVAFDDEDRCVVAYGETNRLPRDLASPVFVWRWRGELPAAEAPVPDSPEITLDTRARDHILARFGAFEVPFAPSLVPGGPAPRLRFLIDGEAMIDIVTGKFVGRVAGDIPIHDLSWTGEWALVTTPNSPANRSAQAVAPYVPWLSSWLHSDASSLYDVSAGRCVATLGKGTTYFSREGNWFVQNETDSSGTIDIWSLSSPRPWGRAFAYSLVFPALVLARRFFRRRADAAASGGPPLQEAERETRVPLAAID
jgi:hypothetical protein